MEIKYGFLATKLETEDGYGRKCDDRKCTRSIPDGADCYIDTENHGFVYCFMCGPCVRYARKKQRQREKIKDE